MVVPTGDHGTSWTEGHLGSPIARKHSTGECIVKDNPNTYYRSDMWINDSRPGEEENVIILLHPLHLKFHGEGSRKLLQLLRNGHISK